MDSRVFDDDDILGPRAELLADVTRDVPGALVRSEADTLDVPVGVGLLPRLLGGEWIHRRVEVIRFVGPSRVRRHVSLDLEVPADLQHERTVRQHRRPCTVVPLAYLPKTRDEHDQNILRDFDARDEDERPVPILGRGEGTLVTWSTLAVAANRAVGKDAHAELLPLELDLLWCLAAAPSFYAREVVRHIQSLVSPEDPQLCPTLAAAAKSHSFAYLAGRLASDYMLLGDLGEVGTPQRRVIKYAYDTNWPGSHDDSASPGRRERRARVGHDEPPPSVWQEGRARGAGDDEQASDHQEQRRTRWLHQLHQGLGRLGITPTPVMFTLGSPIPCQSYHFEFETPDGLEIVSSQLHAVLPLPQVREERHRGEHDARVAEHRTVTHVHMSTIRPGEALASEVWLKTVLSSGPVMAVLGGALLTLGLLAGSRWPEPIVHSRSVVVSVALLLPGLLAGSMLARHSHDVVGRLGWGMQVLTGIILLLSAGAVVSLAATTVFDPGGALDFRASAERLQEVWDVLWVAAAVVTLFLVPSLRPYRWWRRGLP